MAAIALGLVVVLVAGWAVLGCGDGGDDGDDEVTTRESSDGVGDEATPGSVMRDTPPLTTAPPPPPPPPSPPPEPLPGVTAQGVIDGLGGVGWTCTLETGMYPEHVQHNCGDAAQRTWLDMVSTEAGDVLYVDVSGYEEHIGAFEEVASLGWTGVDGSQVAAWIESTTTHATAMGSQDAKHGEVYFTLIGDPASPVGSWALRFGRPP